MADRKAELERKKEKLRQIREEKERRRKERETEDVKQSASRIAEGGVAGSGAASLGPASHDDINRQLQEMGISPFDDVLKEMAKVPAPVSGSQAGEMAASALAGASDGSPLPGGDHPRRRTAASRPTLGITPVHQTSIPPKQSETYTKQTQTLETGSDSMIPSRRGVLGGRDMYTIAFDEPEDLYDEDSLPGLGSGSPSSGSPSGLLRQLPPGILHHGMPEVKDVKPAVTKEEQEEKKKQEEEERRRKMELSEEEKQIIVMSEDFRRFFDRSSRLVERALHSDSSHLFADYIGGFEDAQGLDADKAGAASVTFNRYFSDERWTKNRVVTSMDWSTTFPELLVASYDKNPDSASDPDGVCLVWNTRFKKTTPEHIFHCQSQVMSSTFARFHPNLILGGTYSGQIVLWDNRVMRRTPVQRSPLSASAHTHPVYCMKVVGTQNAHNLISISTDGRLCSWSLDMLSQPQESLELQQKQSRPVAATCLSFPAGDVNNFIVGSEEGAVYTACRHGSRAGVLDVFEGHQAPVTGLDAHPSNGPIDFGHLFLTSSMDWTVKLWSLKENRPMHSFEDNGDYVYDAAWSPVHPALFATVDGTGRLDLWNLNSDTEVPTVSVPVGSELASGLSSGLNRVSWTQSGLHVTVGDDTGKIWVYDVGEQLALPGADEWSKFAYTLQDLKNNQTDEESLHSVMSSGSMSALMSGGVAAAAGGAMTLGGGSGPGSLTSLPSLTAPPMR